MLTNPTVVDMLWKISLQAAVVALVVWIIARLAPKAPAAWRHALWLLVLVKFLVPPFAYYPSQAAFWKAPARPSASAPAPRAAVNAPARANRTIPQAPSSTTQSPAGTSSLGYTQSPNFEPVGIVVIAWLTGALGMLGLLMLRFARQVRLVRESAAAGREALDLLADAAASMGIRRLPGLRVSLDARTPMLVGCLRPVILLPSDITGKCGPHELRAMLLHELAHIKRRDMAVMWLQQIVQVLFFFHPALWLAAREIRRERELACDELVLSRSAIRARDYAAGYVSALKLANGLCAGPTSLAMAEPFDIEKKRLGMILRKAMPRFSAWWFVALGVAAVIGLPTFVGLTQPEPKTAGELLVKVAEARANALAQVKSGRGGMAVQEWFYHTTTRKMNKMGGTARVIFSGDKFRITANTTDQGETGRIEGTFDGRTFRTVDNGRIMTTDVNSEDGKMQVQSARDLFDVVGRAYPDLSKMMPKGAGAPRIVGHETIDGDRCIVLCSRQVFPRKNGGSDTNISMAWIDPAKGYAVPRVRLYVENSRSKRRTLLSWSSVKLKRYGSVWGAAEYSHEERRIDPKTGKDYVAMRDVFTYNPDFTLNVPVTDKDLQLPLVPPNTSARDMQADELHKARVLAGLTPVTGPGIVVTLRDSPKMPKTGNTAGDYLVHDRDVRDVVNELFAAGAEAISVNGQRLVANSSIRSMGPVIMVNKAPISVPIEIRAVGKPDVLEKALKLPGGVAEGLFLLDMIQVKKSESTEVPAFTDKALTNMAKPD